MFRIYVFPTEPARPSFGLLTTEAAVRLNVILRENQVDLSTSVTARTLGQHVWERVDEHATLP